MKKYYKKVYSEAIFSVNWFSKAFILNNPLNLWYMLLMLKFRRIFLLLAQSFNLQAESQVSTYFNWLIKFISLFAEFSKSWKLISSVISCIERKRKKITPFLPQDQFPFDVFVKGKDDKDNTIRI